MIKLNKKHSIDFTKILDRRNKLRHVVAKPVGPYYMFDAEIKTCTVCNDVAPNVCPTCLWTPYCSNKCFLQDKAAHAQTCCDDMPYELITEPDGSYFMVMNHLPQGTRVLADDIPVVLPTLPDEFKDGDADLYTLPMICFGCHLHFYPDEKQEVCIGCGIPKCSKNCSGAHHNEGECEILKLVYKTDFSTIFKRSSRKYIEFYLDICVLRVIRNCFLHAESNAFVAQRYKRFTLLATTPRFKKFHKTKEDPHDGISYLTILKSVERLPMSLAYALYNRDAVLYIYKTMIIFWEKFETRPGIMSRLFFVDRNFMTQSYCSPNVAASVLYDSKDSEPSFVTYTTVSINKIFDGYVRLLFDFSPSRFMPLPLRMEYLNGIGLDKQFCQRFAGSRVNEELCTLCNDPSDGGSNTGSIKCLKCGEGLYIEGNVRNRDSLQVPFPTRWTDKYVKNVDWNCNECGDVQPFSFILDVNRKFERIYLDEIRNRYGGCRLLDIRQFVDTCEKYLHSLNGVILRAKYDFVKAAREKHFHECGFGSNGHPLDPYFEEKCEMRLIKRESVRVKLFPVHWNKDEVILTKIRANYATDCLSYLTSVRTRGTGIFAMEYFPDFVFLRIERNILDLVISCYNYLQSDSDDGKKFRRTGNTASKAIAAFYRNCFIQYGKGGKLMVGDPLLKYPAEMKLIGDLIERNDEPKFVTRLILQAMKISQGEFILVDGAEAAKKTEKEDGKTKN